MNTGEKIRYFRKKAGLTQDELASGAGISVGSVRSYEIGTRNPRDKTLKKIAETLNVSVDELSEPVPEFLETDSTEEKFNFAQNFNHSLEQMMLYDPLQFIRLNIDSIENGEQREKIAKDLRDVLVAIADFQKEYDHMMDEEYSVRRHWNMKQKQLSKALKGIEDLFNSYESSKGSPL